MENNYTKEIIHQFELTKDIPLDCRSYLKEFKNFNTDIPKTKRYAGLITWVSDKNMFYVIDDLKNPVSLVEFLGKTSVTSLRIENEPIQKTYRSRSKIKNSLSIIDKLNLTNPKAGNIITIEPMSVSFIYDGINWRYLSGIYNFPTISDYENLPNELKIQGNKVLIGNNKDEYLITSNLSLSKKVTKLNSDEKQTFNFLNDCYYDIDGVLYYYFSDNLYKLGDKILVNENFQIFKNTKIKHNLSSSLIFAIFRINSLNKDVNNLIIYPELKILNSDEIEIQSKLDLEGTLVLITNI